MKTLHNCKTAKSFDTESLLDGNKMRLKGNKGLVSGKAYYEELLHE